MSFGEQMPTVEQTDQQSEKLYPDLASYIRSNKSIACPKAEFSSSAVDILTEPLFKGMVAQDEDNFYYLDSNGDISVFVIGVDDLKNIEQLPDDADESMLYQELEKLGFKTSAQEKWGEGLSGVRDSIIRQATAYRQRKIEEEARKNHKEFDF